MKPEFNVVLIIPTGIGCEIGGHAGDANPVAKLLGLVCDNLILHPNVVNASDINEMPENALYVEGSILDRFLEGEICLERSKSNKILLAVNKPTKPETINAINAAKYTIGCDIEIMELEYLFEMWGKFNEDGTAGGEYYGVDSLITQTENYNFDALAIASAINVPKEVSLHYFREGGINPWGGIEAIVSKRIAFEINKPVAHVPILEEAPEIRYFNEVVDPRMAAEVLSVAFIHCVFKGLHKAPRISDRGLSVKDIDCLVSPWACVGRPHEACLRAGIPIIAVKENKTILNDEMPEEFILVENYLEAAGRLIAMREGISASSVRRPIEWTKIYYA